MKIRRILPLVFIVLLVGCAPTAQMSEMVPPSNENSSGIYEGALRDAINIKTVSGGETQGMSPVLDNESFFSALRQALMNDGLLAEEHRKKYNLDVEILSPV